MEYRVNGIWHIFYIPFIGYPTRKISHQRNISLVRHFSSQTAFLSASASPTVPWRPHRTSALLVLFHFYILPCARSVARRAPRRTPLPPPFGAPICPLGPAGSNRVSIAPGTRLPSPVLGFRRFATAQTHLQPHPTAVAVPGGRDAPLLAAQQRRDIVISRYLDFEMFCF